MTGKRLRVRRHYLAIFLVSLTCYAYFFPRWADWNQNSRFDLVVALVDDHSFAIDRNVRNTGDYAISGTHYYSDKAPGMALAGVPVYAAFRVLVPDALLEQLLSAAYDSKALQATLNPNGDGVPADKLRFFLGLLATTFVVGVLPAAFLVVVFAWLIGCFGGSRREQVVGALVFGLATSAFPYANSLVGHVTSAFLLFTAFALLLAIRRARLGSAWLIVVGFLLGYAVITEYPAALTVAVLGLYALYASGRMAAATARLVAGAAAPLALMIVHDLGAFGTPLPVGYFHSALWSDVHQTGFLSLTYPHLEALWGISFGAYRGLFFLSPYLLLAGPGYLELWRRGLRAEVVVLAAAPTLYFGYNSSSAMWSGGYGVGPRYLVAALPFLALPAAAGLTWAWRKAALRALVVVAVIWSAGAVWAETIGGQSFPDYTANPLFELSLARLAAGDIARNAGMIVGLAGWSSLAPLGVVFALAALLSSAPRSILARLQSNIASGPTRSATWAS
jgi:hypothetical protein